MVKGVAICIDSVAKSCPVLKHILFPTPCLWNPYLHFHSPFPPPPPKKKSQDFTIVVQTVMMNKFQCHVSNFVDVRLNLHLHTCDIHIYFKHLLILFHLKVCKRQSLYSYNVWMCMNHSIPSHNFLIPSRDNICKQLN